MAVYKRDILDVNLETGNIYRSFLNHSIGYKDAKADHFGVRVFRDGEAVNLTGVSVQGVFMPPQGSPIAITSGNIVSGNVAEVVLPQACYNYNGQFTLAIKLVDSSNSVTGTVRIVDGVVDNTHASGTVAPTSAVPTYQEVLSTYEQAIAAINKTVRFDAAQSLTEAQKAQARANIDAVSSATANELAMEIGAIVESVDNNSYIDLGNKWMTFRRGYYSTPAAGSASSYNSSSDYVYALAACQPGDVLKAHTYGSSSVYAWAFLDSSLNVLSRGGTGNFEGTQTAPASTAFALVNNKIGSMGSGYYAYVGGEAIQDQVTSLKSAINDIYIKDATKYITNWVQGYIRNNGTIGSSTTECATGWLTFETGKVYGTIKTGYKARVARYTSTEGTHGVFDAFVINPHTTGDFSFNADSTKYYKMDIMNSSETTLAPSDLPSDVIGYYQEHPTDKTLALENKAADAKTTGDMFNKVYSGRNVLKQSTLTLNKYINNSTGSMGSSDSYAVTDYIEVSQNDSIILTYGSGQVATLRYVAAYDGRKSLLSDKGADTVNSYTVPSSVKYVRISANKTRITSEFANIVLNHTYGAYEKYEPYYEGKLVDFARTNKTDISNILRYTLTTLPAYIVNNLAYKPMGQLSKGYLCLVSDDGDPGLATYTVPMLIAKNVPATFAVMKSSGCWNDDTNKATVLDAVENHGCVLAQHGGTTWDQYDENELNGFFDDEKTFWDSLDVEVYGAVCPAHNINNLIRAVAGGRFGCLRTGYDDAKPRYANYTNGARSNLYGLCSQSALDGTVSTQSATLDYCMTNNLLRIIHWHENEMDADAKARLEAIIDYAKSINMTFITMKDLPWII